MPTESSGYATPAGKYVRLKPLDTRDYDLVYEWAAAGVIPWQWQGRAVGPEGFHHTIWSGTLVHFLIVTSEGRPIGLASAYSANFHHQHCYVQLGFVPDVRRSAWPLEAAVLFIDFLFQKYTFRKVYGEATDSTFAAFRSGIGTSFEVEGSFRNHVYVDGRFQDLHVLSLDREAWMQRRGRRYTMFGAER